MGTRVPDMVQTYIHTTHSPRHRIHVVVSHQVEQPAVDCHFLMSKKEVMLNGWVKVSDVKE